MTDLEPKKPEPETDIRLELFKSIERHRRGILIVAAAVTAAVAFLAITRFATQPTARTAFLEFRPTFSGAREGKYPNGLPFAVSDITAPSVIDQVFDINRIDQFCDRHSFKGGFFVDQQSTEHGFLDAEYRAKLADARLTAIDRDRLMAEYAARRQALPLYYRLVFSAVGGCQGIPPATLNKMLTDVLAVWAEQSEMRRGVLRLQVPILTPGTLDVGLSGEGVRLVRADLLRSALRRLARNVRAVEEKPGAILVRGGAGKTTFQEIRGRIEDLIQARLEPLVVTAGRGLGADSLTWVDEALAAASQDQVVAEGRTRAYLAALREYSGVAQPEPQGVVGQQRGAASPSDLQTLSPQIDRTFIDRILEMSEAHIVFRQDLTRNMVAADVDATESRARVGYYQHLSNALRRSRGTALTGAEVDAKLEEITRDGKALAQQFNALYEEWSAMSLRPAAEMYQVEKPVREEVSRPFSTRSLGIVIIGAALIALVFSFLIFVLRDRFIEWRVRMAGR